MGRKIQVVHKPKTWSLTIYHGLAEILETERGVPSAKRDIPLIKRIRKAIAYVKCRRSRGMPAFSPTPLSAPHSNAAPRAVSVKTATPMPGDW